MILPIICIGDEATDIWYLIETWPNFANDILIISCLIFVVIPFLLIVTLTIYLLCTIDGTFKDYIHWIYPFFLYALSMVDFKEKVYSTWLMVKLSQNFLLRMLPR
jgi:hypothetical protein